MLNQLFVVLANALQLTTPHKMLSPAARSIDAVSSPADKTHAFRKTSKRFRSFFILSLCSLFAAAPKVFAGAPCCQNILIIEDSPVVNITNVLGNVAWQNCPSIYDSGTGKIDGLCATVTTTTTVPGSLAGYTEVWDMRFNQSTCTTAGGCPSDDLTSNIALYESYLASGGSLYIMGENCGFPGRDNGVVTFVNDVTGNSGFASGGVQCQGGAGCCADLAPGAAAANGFPTNWMNMNTSTAPGSQGGEVWTEFAGYINNVGSGIAILQDDDPSDPTPSGGSPEAVAVAFPNSSLSAPYNAGKMIVSFDWQMFRDTGSGCGGGTTANGSDSEGNAANEAYILNAFTFLANCPTTPTPTKTSTPTPTFTNTPTKTFTPTFTNTFTNTPTFTNTKTNTFTNTVTPTFTATITNTFTNTYTKTFTNTFTNTATATFTATNTNTLMNTPTFTNTFTKTFTNTYTNTASNTSTATFTATNTNTLMNTATFTNTFTKTFTATFTNTATNSPTNTNTASTTATATYTNTFMNTPTFTNTFTNTATRTNTGTFTNTFTATASPTSTFTATYTNTFMNTPTVTNTFTNTPTTTNTNTYTSTFTTTDTATQTSTPTDTNSATATDTLQNTATITNTPTATFSLTATGTFTYTVVNTATNTATLTFSATNSFTTTATFTDTPSSTPTSTATSTFTRTPENTRTNTMTNTATSTNTATFTLTFTQTPTNTANLTPSATPTSTLVPTWTYTATPSADIFTVCKNVINTGIGEKACITIGTQFPGQTSLKIYNSAGEHIKTLFDQDLNWPLPKTTYMWDGTNKFGDKVASGIYVIYFIEFYQRHVARLVVIH